MTQILSVTKRSAARAEIEGAIRALSDHQNYIAAELLASAAIDVVSGVSKDAEIETMSSRFDDMIIPDKRKEVKRIIRHPYNFLKHSDRDKNSAIDRYNSEAAIWRVFIAVIDYESCWRSKSMTMMGFLSWFMSRYPNIVAEGHTELSEVFCRAYGDVRTISQTEALKRLGYALRQMDEIGPQLDAFARLRELEHIEI